MEQRYLILTAKQFYLGVLEKTRDVMIQFDLSEADVGLFPEIQLALRLSPDEARQFASALVRKADEAQGI